MKIAKKLLTTMLALAIAITCIAVPAQAKDASPYTVDKKAGIAYIDKLRCPIGNHGTYTTVYATSGDTVISSVKSDSGKLIVKVTEKMTNYNDYTNHLYDFEYRSRHELQFYAKEAGTYTVTFKLKDNTTKKSYTKKIKVFATDIAYPFKSIKYAGKAVGTYSILVTKSSGAFKVVANKTYKIQKIELGKYKAVYSDYNDIPVYTVIKNGASIKLATELTYLRNYKPDSSYHYYYKVDYICPLTPILITYKDLLTGKVYTEEVNLYLRK